MNKEEKEYEKLRGDLREHEIELIRLTNINKRLINLAKEKGLWDEIKGEIIDNKETNNPIHSEYAIKLEMEFDEYRPFKDERDFELFEPCGKNSKIKCCIHKKAPLLYPEICLDPDNLITMCENCVIIAIESFKKFYIENPGFKKQ